MARSIRPSHLAAPGAALILALAACGASGNNGGAATQTLQQQQPPTATPTDRLVDSATATTSAPLSPAPTPLPAIVIERPAAGETVHSPFHVTGSADTFEAVFRLQLRDAAGHVLLDQQVMASSGTGTRGSFDATVTTSMQGAATLVAFERSPKDGSAIHTTTVQITVH
jgi:hypothetical protein